MTENISIETKVCVLGKRMTWLFGSFILMAGLWGSCLAFIVTVNANQKEINGRQAQQIYNLEEDQKESRVDDKEVLKQLSAIAVAIGQIKTKLKIEEDGN